MLYLMHYMITLGGGLYLEGQLSHPSIEALRFSVESLARIGATGNILVMVSYIY